MRMKTDGTLTRHAKQTSTQKGRLINAVEYRQIDIRTTAKMEHVTVAPEKRTVQPHLNVVAMFYSLLAHVLPPRARHLLLLPIVLVLMGAVVTPVHMERLVHVLRDIQEVYANGDHVTQIHVKTGNVKTHHK